MIVKFRDIKSLLLNDDFGSFSAFFHKLINAFECKSYIFAIVAVAVAAVSYFVSVYIAKQKKGVA